jgi:hypothetical protein
MHGRHRAQLRNGEQNGKPPASYPTVLVRPVP